MNRLNKTESAVFLYCRFSIFLKAPFFPDYLKHRLVKIDVTPVLIDLHCHFSCSIRTNMRNYFLKKYNFSTLNQIIF